MLQLCEQVNGSQGVASGVTASGGDVRGAGEAVTADCEVAHSLNLIFKLCWVVAGSSRSGCEGGDAEVDGRRAGCALFDLGEFVVGAVEADLESFDVAEPALALCFGDAGGEVVADLDEPLAVSGVGPEHRAADAGVLVDAGGAERSAAGAGGDLAAFEVAEELGPLVDGWDAVFLAGS